MTLTQTAILTKRIIIFLAIFFLAGISAWVAFIIYKANQPIPTEPPPTPTYKFGILPRPIFPESITPTHNYTFTLDTETGDLPKNIPTVANVYVVPQLGATFLASERVKQLAEKLGFTNGPEIINSSIHRFADPDGGQITINLETGNFDLDRFESSPSGESVSRIISDQKQILEEFIQFLSSHGLNKKALQGGRTQVIYNKSTQKDSDHASISLWPAKLDGLEIVTPKFYSSLVNGIYSKYPTEDIDKFTRLKFTYWEPDETNYSTYAIKSPQVAFEELQNNQATIVVDAKKTTVSLISIRLAYFEPDEYPTYLQPIYVFEGPDFIAYTPAITADYLSK